MPKAPQPVIADPMAWLLEEENPSVRYFTLRKLFHLPEEDAQVITARQAILSSEPVRQILALQSAEGWWENGDFATKPLYRSTLWMLTYLAELGIPPGLAAVQRGCEFLLANAQRAEGDFPPQGTNFHKFTPADMLCQDGPAIWTLIRLGYTFQDERLRRAVDFMANALLEANLACRFNGGLPCAWGGVKALRALAEIPAGFRPENVHYAITRTAEWLLKNNLAQAQYPVKPEGKISEHWFVFGFPRSYQSDILQTASVLVDLGYGEDARLQPALEWIASRRRADNVWKLEETIAKMPVPFEKKGQPSKWITLFALATLQKKN